MIDNADKVFLSMLVIDRMREMEEIDIPLDADIMVYLYELLDKIEDIRVPA